MRYKDFSFSIKSWSSLSCQSSLMFLSSKLSWFPGTNGAYSFFLLRSLNGKSASHGWLLISCAPCLAPSRLFNLRCSIKFMKSAASLDHPGGISVFFISTYLERIWSLISFRDRPRYGLLPSMHSYAITPTAK